MRIKKFKSLTRTKKKNIFSRISWKWVFSGVTISGFVTLWGYAYFFLPSVMEAEQLSFAESTIIYDRAALDPAEDPNEHILYTIHGDENREYIPLEEISPWVIKATLAIEDDGFYSHFGFDVGGLTKAVLNKFFGIGNARGGSTITQQLVKNTFLSPERTILRKFNELLLSIKVEWTYTKDDILELYLNKIPYGNNAFGIEAAAKTYFSKSARDLTIAESAVLASLPKAPTRFNPYGSRKDLLLGFYEYEDFETEEAAREAEEGGEAKQLKVYKKGRKDLVLQRMLDLEKITLSQFNQAWAESHDLEFKTSRTDIKAPHFVFYVRQQLEEKYGKEFLRQGGLRIYTTLDPELQAVAELTVETKSAGYGTTYGAQNVALASFDNETGAILAYIGGKDFFDTESDGQVDVLTSRRQPGSSFKPLVYATGFTKGLAPSDIVFDVETDFGGNYIPQNFDGKFSGPVSFREALNRSLNIPAIKMAYLAGPGNILDLATKLGIVFEGDAERHGVALGVGVAEVEPLSHIASFQTFAGDGTWHNPTAILEVHDSGGVVLEKVDFKKTEKAGLDSDVAALVRHILTDETTRPTTDDFDWNILLQLEGLDNGAKTGTSNRVAKNPEFDEALPEDEDNKKFITVPGDSWTIGFTPHLVTGVWVGNNRGEPMKSGATGMTVAAPVWKSYMNQAHDILFEAGADKEKLYTEVRPLQEVEINKYSGLLASDLTPPKLRKKAFFSGLHVPTKLESILNLMEVDKLSGRPATDFTPAYARTQKYVIDLVSLRPDRANWQNPVTEWLESHPRFLSSLGVIMDEDLESNFAEGEGLAERLRAQRGLRDDVHNTYTQKNPPKISLTSLKAKGKIATGLLDIPVQATSPFGIKSVEFYFNDQLVAEDHSFPYGGQFVVPDSLSLGSAHLVRVVAIDQLLNFSEVEIGVKVGLDSQAPQINFLGPIGNQRLHLNSRVNALVEVKDVMSGVRAVEFFLDQVSLGVVEKAPFELSFETGGSLGRHSLMVEAIDHHGNKATKSIPIIYERENLLQEKLPFIESATGYRSSVALGLVFPQPDLISSAELIGLLGDRVVYQKTMTHIAKYELIQIERGLADGRVRFVLYSQIEGDREPYKSLEKVVDF